MWHLWLRVYVVHRIWSSLSGPVDPSFRALSGRLKFTIRRHKFNKDSLCCVRMVCPCARNMPQVSGVGSRILSVGFRVWALGFRVPGTVFRVSCFVFRISGFQVLVPNFGLRHPDSPKSEFRVSGSGVRGCMTFADVNDRRERLLPQEDQRPFGKATGEPRS